MCNQQKQLVVVVVKVHIRTMCRTEGRVKQNATNAHS